MYDPMILVVCPSLFCTDASPPALTCVPCTEICSQWCLRVECPSCSNSWYVCTTCTGMRVVFLDIFRWNRHHKFFHNQSLLSGKKWSFSSINATKEERPHLPWLWLIWTCHFYVIPSAYNCCRYKTPIVPTSVKARAAVPQFGSNEFQWEQSQIFFVNEHQFLPGMGSAYLAGRSQFGLHHDMEKKLSGEDVNLLMPEGISLWLHPP